MPDKEPAKMIRPPNKIKQKMGPAANVRDLLKPENIEKGQRVIDAHKESFLEWAQEDIDVLTQKLSEILATPMTTQHLEAIIKSGEHLRDRGGTFGYELISKIAKSLVNYCATIQSPSPEHAIVVSKHIEGLSTVLRGRVEGNGGAIGVELLQGLKQLTDKYTGN
ncbi:MAG: hypothetical protein P8P30_02775 [Rickettsiales bacterium]|nr:hypothetical protein [Rickettsiales bacterium]